MNKKGDIFMPLIAFGFLILLTSAIFTLVVRDDQNYLVKDLGKLQGELIKTNQNMEEVLFYQEKNIDVMLEKTLNQFNEQGGFADKGCNAIWQFNSNCEPDLEKNFTNLFKENTDFKNVRFDEDKFVVVINESVIGNVKNANYTYTKTVEIKKDFNLTKEKELQTKIKACLSKDLTTCVDLKGVSVTNVNGNIIFSMENNKKYLFFEPINLEFTLETQEII